eukprot:6200023-Pleurochrysis_carterae.AAC.2
MEPQSSNVDLICRAQQPNARKSDARSKIQPCETEHGCRSGFEWAEAVALTQHSRLTRRV